MAAAAASASSASHPAAALPSASDWDNLVGAAIPSRKNHVAHPLADFGSISGVRFSLSTTGEKLRTGVASIYRSSGKRVFDDVANTVVDPRMGTPDRKRMTCQLCWSTTECPGHTGYIALPFPIFHESFFKYTLELLSCICPFCARPGAISQKLVDAVDLEAPLGDERKRHARFALLCGKTYKNQKSASKTASDRHCRYCGMPLPQLKMLSKEIMEIAWVWTDRAWESIGGKPEPGAPVNDAQRIMGSLPTASRVRMLFRSIPYEDLCMLGLERTPVEEWVPHIISVVPNTVRLPMQSVVMSMDGLPDDLTSKYGDIVNHNEKLWEFARSPAFRAKVAAAAADRREVGSRAIDDDPERNEGSRKAVAAAVGVSLTDPVVAAMESAAAMPPPRTKKKKPTPFESLLSSISKDARRPLGVAAHDVFARDPSDAAKEVRKEYLRLQAMHAALVDNQGDFTQRIQNEGRNTVVKSIRFRLQRKDGYIREVMEGHRTDHAGRVVITGDANLRLDEVGIPERLARNATMPRRVTALNRSRLQEAIRVGPYRLGGACEIVDRAGRSVMLFHHAENMTREEVRAALEASGHDDLLERLPSSDDPPALFREALARTLPIGFVVHTHLQDGDPAVLNRQPTLHTASMQCFFVKIMPGDTMRIHPSVTTPFNADFDGDAMILHIVQDLCAIAEITMLMSVKEHLLSEAASRPHIGGVQDILFGAAHLSKKGIFLDRSMMMQLLMQADRDDPPEPAVLLPKKRGGGHLWTGKQILGHVLTKWRGSGPPESLHELRTVQRRNTALLVPPNHKAAKRTVRSDEVGIAPWVELDHDGAASSREAASERGEDPASAVLFDDHRLIIRDGEILVGQLDAKAFGKGAVKGIVHTMALMAEPVHPRAAMDTMYYIGRVTSEFLRRRGFSISMKDLRVEEATKAEIAKDLEMARARAWDLVRYGKKIGASREAIETCAGEVAITLQNTVLARVRADLEQRLSAEDASRAELIVRYGSKGSLADLLQITGCVGQQSGTIGGRMQAASCDRPTSSMVRGDRSLVAGGFVLESLDEGLRLLGMLPHAKISRASQVMSSTGPAKSGYLERRLLRTIEELVASAGGAVVTHCGRLVMPRYGADGCETRRLVRVPTKSWVTMGETEVFELLRGRPEALASFQELVGWEGVVRWLRGRAVVVSEARTRDDYSPRSPDDLAMSPAMSPHSPHSPRSPDEARSPVTDAGSVVSELTAVSEAESLRGKDEASADSELARAAENAVFLYMSNQSIVRNRFVASGTRVIRTDYLPLPWDPRMVLETHVPQALRYTTKLMNQASFAFVTNAVATLAEDLQPILGEFTTAVAVCVTLQVLLPLSCVPEPTSDTTGTPRVSRDGVRCLMSRLLHFAESRLVPNGEPVGSLAALVITEKETQNLLNTFHNAGQTDASMLLKSIPKGIERIEQLCDVSIAKVSHFFASFLPGSPKVEQAQIRKLVNRPLQMILRRCYHFDDPVTTVAPYTSAPKDEVACQKAAISHGEEWRMLHPWILRHLVNAERERGLEPSEAAAAVDPGDPPTGDVSIPSRFVMRFEAYRNAARAYGFTPLDIAQSVIEALRAATKSQNTRMTVIYAEECDDIWVIRARLWNNVTFSPALLEMGDDLVEEATDFRAVTPFVVDPEERLGMPAVADVDLPTEADLRAEQEAGKRAIVFPRWLRWNPAESHTIETYSAEYREMGTIKTRVYETATLGSSMGIEEGTSVTYDTEDPDPGDSSKWIPATRNGLLLKGSNLMGFALSTDLGVDWYASCSTNLHEVAMYLGLEAAISTLRHELMDCIDFNTMKGLDTRHLDVLVNAMSMRGVIVPTRDNGLATNGDAPMKHISFEKQWKGFVQYSSFGVADPGGAPTSAVILGVKPAIGTGVVGLRPLEERDVSKLGDRQPEWARFFASQNVESDLPMEFTPTTLAHRHLMTRTRRKHLDREGLAELATELRSVGHDVSLTDKRELRQVRAQAQASWPEAPDRIHVGERAPKHARPLEEELESSQPAAKRARPADVVAAGIIAQKRRETLRERIASAPGVAVAEVIEQASSEEQDQLSPMPTTLVPTEPWSPLSVA
jgi:DNA-directed RNA polymerase beta' subunit